MFTLKNDKYHKLETGWNDRVIEHRESKYIRANDRGELLQLVSLRSTAPAKGSADTATGNESVFSAKPATATKKAVDPRGGSASPSKDPPGTASMFESITKAVGFKHHRGTDRNTELKVLKSILQRENKLIELQTECNKINQETPNLRTHDRTGILDLLSQIRDLTVVILENVTTWRETMVNADPEAPRPFMWQKQNYVLKMVDDLNFLSYVDPLVAALKIHPEKLVKNPLMLPETLEGTNVGDEAFVRAQDDAHGNSKGPVFLERLRLRIAEQVFVKEIEFNKFGMPSIAWTEYNPSVASVEPSVASAEDGSVRADQPAQVEQYNEERKMALLDWQIQANRQLKRILTSQGEQLRSASTHRLSIPSPSAETEEFSGCPKFSYYPTPVVVPSLLTDLHLGAAEEENTSSSPVYLRGHLRNSPQLDTIASNENRQKSAAKGTVVRSSRREPQTVSPSNNAATDSDEDSFGAFADTQEKKTKGLREIRGLPESSTRKIFADPVPTDVIAPLLTLEAPPTTVLRATGAVRILLAEPGEIPDDLTWSKFLELAESTNVAQDMSGLDVNLVPKFKIRAVTPFLEQLSTPMDMDEVAEEVKVSVERVTSWIQQVVDIASGEAPPNVQPPSSSPTGSAFGHSRAPVKGSSQRNNKPVRPRKTTRDTQGGGPTELRLLAYRAPTPHDSNLAIVYSEMVSNLFVRPVVLSLLVPSIEKEKTALPTASNTNIDSFKKGLDKSISKHIVAKVYDAATSQTSETVLNLREYIKYQAELVQVYNDESVKELFQPEKVGWWIENLKHVSTVSVKPGGSLALRISKSMIGRRVARYLGVYMSRDSGDQGDGYMELNESSAESAAGGDLYGAPNVRLTGKKTKTAEPVKAARKLPPNEVVAARASEVRTAPRTKKTKSMPPRSTSSSGKPKLTAIATVKSDSPATSKKVVDLSVEMSSKGHDISQPVSHYGSAFVETSDSKSNAEQDVKPVEKSSSRKSEAKSGKVLDPYSEPNGGFKMATGGSDKKPNVSVRSSKEDGNDRSSSKTNSNEKSVDTLPSKPMSSKISPKTTVQFSNIESKSGRVNDCSSSTTENGVATGESLSSEPNSNDTAKLVPAKAEVTNPPAAILGETMSSTVYDDEFEEDEPPATTVPVLSTVAPEETTGYDDDFDEAGDYADEFEDVDSTANLSRKSAAATEPAHIPVQKNDIVLDGAWDQMKKQLTQELESQSEMEHTGKTTYQDDFDPIGNDIASFAEGSKFGAADEEIDCRKKNINNTNASKIAGGHQSTFDLEVMDDEQGGGASPEGDMRTLRDAVVNAAASVGDDEYGDDEFDD